MKIAKKGTADVAIAEGLSVQSDDPVDVDMIPKLRNQLNEFDVLLIGFGSEHVSDSHGQELNLLEMGTGWRLLPLSS